uniref:BPTI/Kunitz inhibitor domain-containing protein n=1 Tax=Meloidogyne hapla TaxID=6305 RepID=A0A1I8BR88_MELHA
MVRRSKYLIKTLIIFINLLEYFQVYAAPSVGPCSINAGIAGFPQNLLPKLPGTNPRLKCTDKGAEATSTKSLSNRITPECGRCLRSLARYYKNSDDFLFRPLCDAKTGFCVNVLSGVKLSKEEKPNSQTTCNDGHYDFSIDSSLLTKSEKLPSGLTVEQRIPLGNPLCKLLKDSGEGRCNGHVSKGVKWYFDVDTFECLAFNYNGCGGNKNRFDTVTECWDQCKLGMTLPATNSHGHTIVCSSMEAGSTPIQSCPAGYRCTMLAFMGLTNLFYK